MLFVANYNWRTGYGGYFVMMVFKEVGVGKDNMDMTGPHRYHLAGYPGKTVVMRLLFRFSYFSAALKFMDVALTYISLIWSGFGTRPAYVRTFGGVINRCLVGIISSILPTSGLGA